MEETKIYAKEEFDTALILESLKQVIEILEERGYDATNQIVGYLMSGDPGYITSYKGARLLLTKFERSKILEVLLNNICDI